MPRVARISKYSIKLLVATFAFFLAFGMSSVQAQGADAATYAAGEKLFRGNCASCHKVDKDMTGPAIKGARERWDGKGDIYEWIKNSTAYLKTGNAYANELFVKWNKSPMTGNAVTNEEIDAILYYADNFAPPVAVVVVEPGTASNDEGAGSAWTWLIVIALLLAIVAASLGGVKRSLDNAVREAEGRPALEDLTRWQRVKGWASKNKAFATVIVMFFVVWGFLGLWDAAFNIGVYGGEEVAHYKPEQPIAFDHTLHAGKDNLAINCQYCHSSASKSKHAGIPSANVCMNCHKAVEAGTKTGRTTEIAKIYAAVGWNPQTQSYSGKEEPIRWVKVHNLPDHVYFNHQQHVVIGQLECQECHGPVDTEMDVVEQWAPLTMGWCIDCHGTKEVKMAGNGYYDEVMARLEETDMGHEQLMEYLEDDKITVKELGGWECAKCHY